MAVSQSYAYRFALTPCRQSPLEWPTIALSLPLRLKHDVNRMNPNDLKKLVEWRMPFGKYQGRLLADLPGPYLNWFAREGFPNGELGALLALMHEIDHNGLKDLLDPLR